MNKDTLLNQCVEYFKSTPGFYSSMERIREKYRSLGCLGGTIQLDNLSPEEKDALSGLLRKDYYSRKSAGIRVEHFIQALENTKFQGVDFEEVLKAFFNQNLLSKKEERNLYEQKRKNFFKNILHQFSGTKASLWLESITETAQNAYPVLRRRYDEDRTSLKKDLLLTCTAINALSFQKAASVRLALFSSSISMNPHCFDPDSECGKLLLYGISYLLDKPYPQNAEEKAEMLYNAGIMSDEVSNFTICSGLLAYQAGKIHPGWQGFYDAGEPMHPSLSNLSSVDQVKSPAGKVYVFENPTVFSEVYHSTQSTCPSLICTYGQVKLASLILLDKLAADGSRIYYSGDLDPEGLAIADRLKQRYGEKLHLWRYSINDYSNIKSGQPISPERLKKLENLKSAELHSLAAVISREGFAAYQELLVSQYIEDIFSNVL